MALATDSCISSLVSGSKAQRRVGDTRKNNTAANNADLRMIRSLVWIDGPHMDLAELNYKNSA
jgi:hypothetical protein